MSDKEPHWLYASSERSTPYTIDDITVFIPSAAKRYIKRWTWFWPQYVDHTDPSVVEKTIIVHDEDEHGFFEDLVGKECMHVYTDKYGIVDKTLVALSLTERRLFFRLANDILVVRKGWEQVLLDRFNAMNTMQIIAEIQHGQIMPDDPKRFQLVHPWFEKTCDMSKIRNMVYPQGSRLFGQTALFRAYFPLVRRFTNHYQDEFFFSQLLQADGVHMTKFGNINAYFGHMGLSNKDFTEEQIVDIEEERMTQQQVPDDPKWRDM